MPGVRRVWVLGTSGSGKTTIAAEVARRLGVPHVEIDWLQHGPDWAQATPEELGERLDVALGGDAWVADGNYHGAREAHFHRAELVVWLDYDRRLVMSRVVRRTAGRLLLRRRIFNGNRERWRNLLDPGHPIRWAWSTHARRRVENTAAMDWAMGPAAQPARGGDVAGHARQGSAGRLRRPEHLLSRQSEQRAVPPFPGCA
ncbi:MAG TPA: AAA family ATPase [Candidatus Dormibacteraeota bacterium]|nr:AAA family ATPase [Candidatus Dormibacteraeota bacterium]